MQHTNKHCDVSRSVPTKHPQVVSEAAPEHVQPHATTTTAADHSTRTAPQPRPLSALVCVVAKALHVATTATSSEPAMTASHADVPKHMLCFYSAVIPPITAEAYVHRIARYMRCSEEVYVIAGVLLERVLRTAPAPNFRFTPQNIHRFLIAAVVVAAKVHDDRVCSNAWYATVAGMPLPELNRLEALLLSLLSWEVQVDGAAYADFVRRCVSGGSVLQMYNATTDDSTESTTATDDDTSHPT
eukprot:PhM_4_TR1303/c2_g3_i4/m.105455